MTGSEKCYLKFLRSERHERKIHNYDSKEKYNCDIVTRVADADKKERNKVQEMQLNE